jgi:hypothetical protein
MKSIIPLFDTYSHNHTIRRTRMATQTESYINMKWKIQVDLIHLFNLENLIEHLQYPPK